MAELPALWRDQFIATREIPGCGLCAVQRFAYTCGLLTGLRFDGHSYFYVARYCYPNGVDALRDLAVWDGQGDPPGEWVKEKVSERMRDAEDDESENVCEHGDHRAPEGKRFCSEACARCELADAPDGAECAGICLRREL
jgi:hypothetical protein